MKKCLLTFLGLLSFSSNAYFFNMNCQFNQAFGKCSVYNSTYTTLRCQLNVYGQTVSGFQGIATEHVLVYPGSFAYATIYANNPSFDPLAFVQGNAYCY